MFPVSNKTIRMIRSTPPIPMPPPRYRPPPYPKPPPNASTIKMINRISNTLRFFPGGSPPNRSYVKFGAPTKMPGERMTCGPARTPVAARLVRHALTLRVGPGLLLDEKALALVAAIGATWATYAAASGGPPCPSPAIDRRGGEPADADHNVDGARVPLARRGDPSITRPKPQRRA